MTECQWCGAQFEPAQQNQWQKYCQRSCEVKRRNERLRQGPRCDGCDRVLAKGQEDGDLCSPDCHGLKVAKANLRDRVQFMSDTKSIQTRSHRAAKAGRLDSAAEYTAIYKARVLDPPRDLKDEERRGFETRLVRILEISEE